MQSFYQYPTYSRLYYISQVSAKDFTCGASTYYVCDLCWYQYLKIFSTHSSYEVDSCHNRRICYASIYLWVTVISHHDHLCFILIAFYQSHDQDDWSLSSGCLFFIFQEQQIDGSRLTFRIQNLLCANGMYFVRGDRPCSCCFYAKSISHYYSFSSQCYEQLAY